MITRTILALLPVIYLVPCIFAVVVHGQVIQTLDWPNTIEGMRGSNSLLFLQDSKELTVFELGNGKLSPVDHQQALRGFDLIVITPSGTVLATQSDSEQIRIFKLNDKLERVDFAKLPQSEVGKPFMVVVNESESIVWLVSTGSAIAIDARTKTIIRRINSERLPRPDARAVYAACRKDLVVGVFQQPDNDDGWNIELFRDNSNRHESLLILDRTLLLQLLVGPKGELLVCAREDLHWPNTGLVACYEASTFSHKWKVDSVYPLSGCVLNNRIWIEDGSNILTGYELKDGALAHRIDVDKEGIRKLAVINNPPAIFALSTNRKRLFQVQPPKN